MSSCYVPGTGLRAAPGQSRGILTLQKREVRLRDAKLFVQDHTANESRAETAPQVSVWSLGSDPWCGPALPFLVLVLQDSTWHAKPAELGRGHYHLWGDLEPDHVL